MLATQTPSTPTVIGADPVVGVGVPEPCVNCGRLLSGPYCTVCGEQRASDRDYSFWGFAKEVLQTVTSADRSFVSSIRTLLNQPGELAAEYMRGRRVGTMRPLQLFLLVNVIYFLFASATNGGGMLTTTLYNQLNNTWHSRMATQMVRKKLGSGKVSPDVYDARLASYRKKFDTATAVQAKTLIFTMVPAFALLVGLIHAGRRRYLVEHLVFALHFYSAFLVMAVLIVLSLAVPMALMDWLMRTAVTDSPLLDPLIGLVIASTLIWYLRRALSRAYGDGPIFSAVGAVVLTVGVVLILFGYRTLLFLTTFLAT